LLGIDLGVERVTTLNLEVAAVDAEKGLIMLKGAVPGAKGSYVRVRDALVAPKHAEIRAERGQFVLRAQPGQTVFVNDAPVQVSPLPDGAKLRVGNTKLTFRRK
jgi:hypothetical protein